MRVTRESLVRIAKETAQERSFNDRSIIAAYLTGSLVGDGDPMLGGTTDIDLVLVHGTPPPVSREIVKLTADFHVDIRHRAKSDFKSTRELRADPELGYELYDPMLLWQREKFFEFFQAGLRAGFEFQAPSLVLARCRRLLTEARKGWIDLSDISAARAGPLQVKQFLRALEYAADAVAELNGGPLAERRFLREFPARAEAAERPAFTEALFNLLGASQIDAETLSGWLPAWGTDFLAAAQDPKVDPGIHAARLNYYEKGIQALLASETPITALWPLIHTWTLASRTLDSQASSLWQAACRQLGLLGEAFERRVSDLDGYLDEVELRLDEIALASGVETPGRV
jgi:hypothetical protein